MDQTPGSDPPDVTYQSTSAPGIQRARPEDHVCVGLSWPMLPSACPRGCLWRGFVPRPGPSLAAAVFVGIVFCQTSLLGIWGGLGMSSWWNRLLGVMVGMGYLGLLLDFCLVRNPIERQPPYRVARHAAGSRSAVDRPVFRGPDLPDHRGQDSCSPDSVLHPAIVDPDICCRLPRVAWKMAGTALVPVTEPFLLALIGLVLATVGLISIWPVLGTRQPILPGIIAVGIAAGLGFGLTRLSPHLPGCRLSG